MPLCNSAGPDYSHTYFLCQSECLLKLVSLLSGIGCLNSCFLSNILVPEMRKLCRQERLALSSSQQSPNPLQILWCIHSDGSGIHTGHTYAITVFQHPKLLQRLGLFQRRRRQGGKYPQEAATVGVKPYMLHRHPYTLIAW